MNILTSPTFIEALSLFGTATGFVYIILQYKAHPWFWYVSLFTALPMLYVNAVQGNYATAILFFYYAVVTLMVLFEKVAQSRKTGKAQPAFVIVHTPTRFYLPLLIAFLALTAAFFFGIEHFKALIPEQFRPINYYVQMLDSSMTALSFVSMWMLKKNYLECWIGWIVVNLGYTLLYLLLANWSLAANFAFWLLIACFGLPKWKRLMKEQQHTEKPTLN